MDTKRGTPFEQSWRGPSRRSPCIIPDGGKDFEAKDVFDAARAALKSANLNGGVQTEKSACLRRLTKRGFRPILLNISDRL